MRQTVARSRRLSNEIACQHNDGCADCHPVSHYTAAFPRETAGSELTDQSGKDAAAQARATLTAAYTELGTASKVAVGDDGKSLLAAAAAVDLAVELLTPPDIDAAMASASCREALELTRGTRSYAQGGTIAKALEPAKQKLESALKLLGS